MDEAFETPEKRSRGAVLVGIAYAEKTVAECVSLLCELSELAGNLGLDTLDSFAVKLRVPNPHFCAGRGRVEEICARAEELHADCIILDDELSPAQQRNWESLAGRPVINRQEIILEIFARRASTREARLQVELAKLEYALPRLGQIWSNADLDRQRGGGITQRGGGESRLELDRRAIRSRIAALRRELERVRTARDVQRKRRMRVPMPTAAIVGYTNAGKSSLINLLAGSELLSEDKLFATLDPSTRRMALPNGQVVLLTDTVGFVRNLPHKFVEAFKATLEEALVSDFLIHVVDSSSPDAEEHIATTLKVLKELGADKKKIVTVFNKTDISSDNFVLLRSSFRDAVWISVKKRLNIQALIDVIAQAASGGAKFMRLRIPHSEGAALARLYKTASVSSKKIFDDFAEFEALVPLSAESYFNAWKS